MKLTLPKYLRELNILFFWKSLVLVLETIGILCAALCRMWLQTVGSKEHENQTLAKILDLKLGVLRSPAHYMQEKVNCAKIDFMLQMSIFSFYVLF